jgi:2',3'-cyclic-nucleotide 2'-phosphodiesterase (5'-nucleotidase family)
MQRLSRLLRIAGIVGALWLAFSEIGYAFPRADDILFVTAEMTTRNVRGEESKLANLIADAIRNVEKSDAAFITASAFAEATLSKGTATISDILKALEVRSDRVVIVKLTGKQIRQALEHSLALFPQKSSALLHVSGLKMNADSTREKGSRVTSVKINGSEVQDDKTYTVAMPSPLANGALAYSKVWSRSDVDHETTRTLEQAITDYLTNEIKPKTAPDGSGQARIIGDDSEERLVIKK